MQMTKTYGNGFDHMESELTFRDFVAWWNEKSHFPFDTLDETEIPEEFPIAA